MDRKLISATLLIATLVVTGAASTGTAQADPCLTAGDDDQYVGAGLGDGVWVCYKLDDDDCLNPCALPEEWWNVQVNDDGYLLQVNQVFVEDGDDHHTDSGVATETGAEPTAVVRLDLCSYDGAGPGSCFVRKVGAEVSPDSEVWVYNGLNGQPTTVVGRTQCYKCDEFEETPHLEDYICFLEVCAPGPAFKLHPDATLWIDGTEHDNLPHCFGPGGYC